MDHNYQTRSLLIFQGLKSRCGVRVRGHTEVISTTRPHICARFNHCGGADQGCAHCAQVRLSPFFCSLGTSYITFPPSWSSDLQIKTRSKGRGGGKTRQVNEFKTLRIRSVGLRTAPRLTSCAFPAFQQLFCQQQTLGAFLEASLVSSVPKFQPCFRRFLCALAQTCRRVFSPWRSLSRSNGLVIWNTRINSGSALQWCFFFKFLSNLWRQLFHKPCFLLFGTISPQKWIFDPDIPTNFLSSLVWGGACGFGVCGTYFVLGFLCGG